AHAHGSSTGKILIEAQKLVTTFKPAEPILHLFHRFEYIFAEALVLTGHYEESLYYIHKITNNAIQRNIYLDNPFYQSLNLFQALALYKTGCMEQAEKIFNAIRPSEFYFLSK